MSSVSDNAVVFNNEPSVPVVIRSGRSITRVMDFTNEKGEKVHIERRALQGSFVDATGCDSIVVCQPVNGWNFDISLLERKNLTIYCVSFATDRTGVSVLRFNGYLVAPANK